MGCGNFKGVLQLVSNLSELQSRVLHATYDSQLSNNPIYDPCINESTPQNLSNTLAHKFHEIKVKHISYNNNDLNSEINLLREKYTLLITSRDEFYLDLHHQCVKDFTVFDGLFMFFIILEANFQNVLNDIKIAQYPPYIEINRKKISKLDLPVWDS